MCKKILFIGDGQSIHVKKWVDYFSQSGYETALATFSQKNNTLSHQTFILSDEVVNHNGGNYYYLLSIYKLVHIIKKYKPDYINAHFSYSMGFLAVIAKKMAKSKASLSVVCHGSDVLNTKSCLLKNVNRYVLRETQKIYAVSNQITDCILEMGVDGDKIFTGQYGIEKRIMDNDFCESFKDIDIISNRAYVLNSRIDELLESLNKQRMNNKKVIFVLPKIPKEKLDEFRQKYRFISFFDYLDHAEILQLLRRSKIYISATRSDGASLSLLEAMGCGCIPVVSNILSNREWIVDGLNGRLFSSFSDVEDIVFETLLNFDINKNLIDKINRQIIEHGAIYELQMKKIADFLVD